jgi:HEPN domain-containing protein
VLAVHAEQSDVPVHDGVCFHCQQCAEKYLKVLMEELGLPVPKTHTLVVLLASLAAHHRELRPYRRGLVFLTAFARRHSLSRRRRYETAGKIRLRWATKVRASARKLLGIRERKRK